MLHAVEGSLQSVGGDVSQSKGENPQLVASLGAGDGDALRHEGVESQREQKQRLDLPISNIRLPPGSR